MKLSRPSRVVTVLVALFSLLFMQLAVASYVCPGMMKGGSATMTASPDSATSMPSCTGMGKEQRGLCQAKAQDVFGKQSFDQSQSPDVQPFVATSLVLAVQAIEPADGLQSFQSGSALLTRTTAPPIAIRHCCFRI